MDFKALIKKLDPTIYKNLTLAVEIGKWPNGDRLTQEQRGVSLQAIIAYEIEHDFPQEQRVGYVNTKASGCHTDDGMFKQSDEADLLKWRH